MEVLNVPELRDQLLDRRRRLQETISDTGAVGNLVNLLREVDAALERMDNGTFGICIVCNEAIEKERLEVDPLITVCLGHLSEAQQKTLEQDLDLASRIQRTLLPKNNMSLDGWEICYHYAPAGPVSGDYCDLIENTDGDKSLLFILGDVSGKGIAASLLMSHMHALFRSLSSFNLPVNELVGRANRLFCESTSSTHYATLVCARAVSTGEIEICNAGHNPPLLISRNGISKLISTGLPIGVFCNSEYSINKVKLQPGDTLIFYTDGLTESLANEIEYGEERLISLSGKIKDLRPQKFINEVLADLTSFLSGNSSNDDLTLMVIKRI
jgi:sigma-B regulation protein RsbU (phosphoserine phosphatase)